MFSFLPSYQMWFVQQSPVRITKRPEDILCLLSGVAVFGIVINLYAVERSSRCPEVSDDMIDHVLAVCIRVGVSLPLSVGRRPFYCSTSRCVFWVVLVVSRRLPELY